jgi:leucyl-tRNA synthetase
LVLGITRCADQLLEGLSDIDWPDLTKRQQIPWIGKSEGGNIHFKNNVHNEKVCADTRRPDTIFGLTFLVAAPEHPLVEKIVAAKFADDVKKYVEDIKKMSDLERTDLAKFQTGIETGPDARNSGNGKRIRIWVADSVLFTYAISGIMAVPEHGRRDYNFALKYGIRRAEVIDGGSADN